MKKTLFRLLTLSLVLVMVLSMGVTAFAAGDEEQIVIDVAHMYAEGDPNTIAIEEAKEYIEEKSDGRITFNIYPNGTYGEQTNSIQAVRMGTLDIFCEMFGSDYYAPAGAIQGPYMFRSYDHWRAFTESDICKELVEKIEEAAGYKIMGIGHFGFRETITTSPVETVEDLSKMKLRVVNLAPYPEAAVVLGATGTPIALADVYMSLETNVVQGTENPLPQIIAMKFYEKAKYLAMTDHMIASQYWICSNNCFDSLSPEDQDLLMETFDIAADRIEELCEAQQEENIQFLEDQGVTVTYPDKQQFIDRLDLVLENHPDWAPIYEAVAELEG